MADGTLRGWGLCLFFLYALLVPAAAQEPLRGVALAIGQADYEHIPKLANPGNDAKRVDEMLTALGFKTDMVDNRSGKRLERDIEDFIADAGGADVALIYYSGHGIEAAGENYLIPVDARPASATVNEDELIKVSAILEELRGRARIVILLLDACRTNPFPPGIAMRMAGGADSVPIGTGGLAAARGVVPVEHAEMPEGLGEIVGFSAAPGQVALDGKPGATSPYAAALARHLAAGGLDFGQVMTLVAEEVYLATKGRQRPWTNTHLRRLLYFGTPAETEKSDEALIQGERRQLLLTIAATPADLRRTVETMAAVEDVPLDGLYAMLRSLGVEARQDPEALGRQLRDGAEKLRTFMAEREALTSSDVEIVRLSGLADQAVTEGALNAAIAFHERAKARVASLETAVSQAEIDIRTRRVEFAAVFAKSAATRALAFDYLAAAEDWSKAYEQIERWDPDKAFDYRLAQADALMMHGEIKGDNAALLRSIELHRTILATVPGDARAADWAAAMSGLGNALLELGQREAGTALLEQGVAAYRAALEKTNAERGSRVRAFRKMNLGIALTALGERMNNAGRLEEAVKVLRDALAETPRAREPLDWARTQHAIGVALAKLGESENGVARLEEAIAAFRAASEEWTRDRMPSEWASIQNNLGVALRHIGDRVEGTARFEESAAAFRAAQQEWTRDRMPYRWAMAQSNLGAALEVLGWREGRITRLEEAVSAYREALREWTRERSPLDWAEVHYNIARLLQHIATRTDETAPLEDSAAAYRAALQEWTKEKVPDDWARAQRNLGIVLQRLGERTDNPARLEEAAAAYRAVLEELSRERKPLEANYFQLRLGEVLQNLGERGSDTVRLAEAAATYDAALQAWPEDRWAANRAVAELRLGSTLRLLGERTKDRAVLERSRGLLRSGWEAALKAGGEDYTAFFRDEIGKVDAAVRALD